MHLIPWWAWTIIAAVLALAEIHVPGSYLIWVALGAAVTAAADAAWGLSIEAQLGVFAGASAFSCLGGYFIYQQAMAGRHPRHAAPLNQRGATLLGERGVVSSPLVGGNGKVRIGDTVWLAEGPDLPEGALVVVTAVKGTRVVVQQTTQR